MAASDIQKKVIAGLAKAKAKAGDSTSPLVYLVKETITGDNNPLNPPVVTTEDVLLNNAVFTSIDNSLIDGSLIKKGDLSLVADFSVELNQGDTIKQGDKRFIIVDTDPVSPFGVSLARKCIVRQQ